MATDDGNAEKKNALNRKFHALLREMNHRVDAVMEEMKKENRLPPGLGSDPEEIKQIHREYEEKIRLLGEKYKALNE